MPGKLRALGAAFGVLAVLLAFALYARDRLLQVRPLEGLEPSEVAKLELTRGLSTVVLEDREGFWRVTAPIEDAADAELCRALVADLSGATLGSVVSEDPSAYAAYGLDEAAATRVRVTRRGEALAVFDAFLGRREGLGWVYLRRSREKPVYLASGLDAGLFARPADDYREHSLTTIGQESAEKIAVKAAGKSFTLTRSSAGWSAPGLPAPRADAFIAGLFNLRARSFAAPPLPESRTGFARPLLEAEVSTSLRRSRLRIGSPAGRGQDGGPAYRYAGVEGRAVVMLVPAAEARALAAALSP